MNGNFYSGGLPSLLGDPELLTVLNVRAICTSFDPHPSRLQIFANEQEVFGRFGADFKNMAAGIKYDVMPVGGSSGIESPVRWS